MTPSAIGQRDVTAARFRRLRDIAALLLFCASLALYLFTAEPTVSYWDCPEYVTVASRLEPGHPPGNPVWMLTARMFTLLSADAGGEAYAVGVMSGVCSALAVLFLFQTLCILLRRLWHIPPGNPVSRRNATAIIGGSAIGASALAVSDTFWFSAVEAEVYAFSAMLTALTFYLIFVWGERRHTPGSSRYLVLIAYLTGLSIGVHQLNLLTLPALAMAMVYFMHPNIKRRIVALSLLLSLLAIAAILFAMMPAVLDMSCRLELWMVNEAGLPLHSGPISYIAVTLFILIAAALVTQRGGTTTVKLLIIAIALWISGILSFGGSPLVGAVIVAVATVVAVVRRRSIDCGVLNTVVWCVACIFIGYCSYGLIMIRGAAQPTMNQGNPGNIFALRSYIDRDQYGGAPLFYGPTPYSEPLYEENISTDSLTGEKRVSYTTFARKTTGENYTPVDSAGHIRYKLSGLKREIIYAPEMNMWFPRIYSSNPDDIESYEGWTGMNKQNMRKVEASYALDSLGNPVGRLQLPSGRHVRETMYKPTVMQNVMMLAGYQISYMYLRYLMWNFSGRQNEVYAQGESDAGNFITGIGVVDRLMLEHPEKMPPDIGRDNPGHHDYLMLPLLLGIVGIVCQLRGGRRGRRQFTVTGMLFILTGLAIVVYLNQTPGEPRERDYSFVGSFYSYCLWIGIGAGGCFRLAMRQWKENKLNKTKKTISRVLALIAVIFPIAVPAIMAIENFDDHNRRHRTITRDFGRLSLQSVPERGLIFVNGDNYTFPLWYLQEVEQYRPDVAVVNLAYLSTLWYPGQLAMEQPGGRALRFSLPADSLRPDILGRFTVADIGHGTLDARQALRSLFTTPPGDSRPCIDADSLRFKIDSDSVTISLREIAEGHSYLRLDKLLMLDIIANNSDIRPVTWHITVPPAQLLALEDNTTPRGLVINLTSLPADPVDTRLWLTVPSLGRTAYVDQPGRQQTALMRHRIALAADASLQRGDTLTALRLARLSEKNLPPTVVPYTTHTDHGEMYSDAIELGRIYLRAGQPADARRLAKAEYERCHAYEAYLESLSPRYARYTKATTRLTRSNINAPLQLWIEAGGNPSELSKISRQ